MSINKIHRPVYSEVLLYLVYMVFGLSWAIAGGMMSGIMKDLHLSVADGSFLTNSVTIAKIIGAISSGWLLKKFGIRYCFAIGAGLIAFSVFSGLANSYPILLVIRFLMGLGGAICLVCLVPAIQKLFIIEKRPLFNGINATSNVVGAIIALGASFVMEAYMGWRGTLSFWGLISLVLALLWVFSASQDLSKNSSDKCAEKAITSVTKKGESSEFADILKSRMLWSMIIFYIFAINYLMVSFTYMPLFYQKYMHFAQGSLGSYSPMIINVGMLIGPFIGAKLCQPLLGRKGALLFAVVFSTITGLLSISLHNEYIIIIMSLLSGIGIGVIFPVFFNLPSHLKNSTPTKTGYLMSVFWCITYILSTLNTWLMGYMVDHTQSFTMSFTYMFTLSILAYIGIALFPIKNKH